MDTIEASEKGKNEASYGHVCEIGHIWALIKMTCVWALLQLNMFTSSVTLYGHVWGSGHV